MALFGYPESVQRIFFEFCVYIYAGRYVESLETEILWFFFYLKLW